MMNGRVVASERPGHTILEGEPVLDGNYLPLVASFLLTPFHK